MRRFLALSLAVFLTPLVLGSRPAEAVSTFSASATAGISVSTDSAGGLDDLAYRGSRARYRSSAQASFDDGVIVDIDDGNVTKFQSPASFGSIFAGGVSLADLLLKPIGKPIEFGEVLAQSDEGRGFGDNSFSGSGANLNLTASVNGEAIDTGDPSFGRARVRWNIGIFFKNLADAPLTATWTVEHILSAAAMADPNGTAFATATFSGAGAPDVINAAKDPPIPGDADNDGVPPNPPALSGTSRFNFALDPGQTKQFRFALEARGNATIVPAPASGLLLLTGLAISAGLARRRQRHSRGTADHPQSGT